MTWITANPGGLPIESLGGWLLDCICVAGQWFERELRRGRKTYTYVNPTPEFLEKDEIMNIAELSARWLGQC